MLQQYQDSAWTKSKLKAVRGNIDGLQKKAKKRPRPESNAVEPLKTDLGDILKPQMNVMQAKPVALQKMKKLVWVISEKAGNENKITMSQAMEDKLRIICIFALFKSFIYFVFFFVFYFIFVIIVVLNFSIMFEIKFDKFLKLN